MTSPTIRASRRIRNIAWVAGFTALVLMALVVVYSQARNRLTDPAEALPAPTLEAGGFDGYERTNSARDEAQVAHDRAAYEAYEQTHRTDKPPALRKPPETPVR